MLTSPSKIHRTRDANSCADFLRSVAEARVRVRAALHQSGTCTPVVADVASHKAVADVVKRTPFTLHGVAFSGADSAGAPKIRHVWRAWPGASPILGSEKLDRNGLRRRIEESTRDGLSHLWRIDTPLSIAREHLAAQGVAEEWNAIAAWMASFPSARDWRRAMRTTDRKELRRACDRARSTPLAPTNLRLFKQTWALIAEVAHPLASKGVRIEPCTGDNNARVAICESNTASTLDTAEIPSTGYRGAGNAAVSRRESILTWLRTRGVGIGAELAQLAVDDTEGDILDALILMSDPVCTVTPDVAAFESWIY